MPDDATRKDKIEHPEAQYDTPDKLVKDAALSPDEKKEALNTWEQDARQMVTASNEGMPGPDEGIDKDDHHQLGQVERAKERIGEKPKSKSSR